MIDQVGQPMPPPAISLGLSRVSHLLRSLSSPHLRTPIVHIAGTNGKGSVSAYLSAILLSSKLRVGRFNSPHLVDEWDCLEIGGRPISHDAFARAKAEVTRVNDEQGIHATSFELLTATAFKVLAGEELDLAVVEVGMGGRTDATNVVDADRTLLSIVTSIELDHQHFLGDTIREIAGVKAGIVKEGVDAVLAKQAHEDVVAVLEETANEVGATVHFAGEGVEVVDPIVEVSEASLKGCSPSAPLVSLPLSATRIYPSTASQARPSSVLAHLPLPGSYQLANAAAATVAAQVLRTSPRIAQILPALATAITDDSIRVGIEATRWPGRLDWIDWPIKSTAARHKRVLVDGAHNPSSAAFLASYLSSLAPHLEPTTLILGLSAPRPPAAILEPLLGQAKSIKRVIAVPFTPPPSMPWIKPTPTAEIVKVARELGVEVSECETVREAFAGVGEEEGVVVAGSLYLAADVYRLVKEQQ